MILKIVIASFFAGCKAGLTSMQNAIQDQLENNTNKRSNEMTLTATILGLNQYGCWCYFEDIDKVKAFGEQE